jgi:hypothetical protein
MSFLQFEIARRICSCLSGGLALWPRIASRARNHTASNRRGTVYYSVSRAHVPDGTLEGVVTVAVIAPYSPGRWYL